MTQPVKATMTQQGVHAGEFGMLQDVPVGDVVLPTDVKDVLEALHMEGVKLALLPFIGGPGFTPIEYGTENTGLTDTDLGVFCHGLVLPYPL